jgi:GNAT superfamily N-acetyltransferase
VHLRPLQRTELPEAAALLTAALPWDHGAVVAEEKLFGGNGPRTGQTTGAFTAAGELVGLLAQAGRFLKLLAVHPDAQRRGIGTALLEAARTTLATAVGPPPRLRIGDHAGNYLAPGVDERYVAGHAFFRARGLVEVGRNLNLRAPLVNNPLCSRERCQELQAAATGYTLRRATAADVPALLTFVESAFAPLWAYEVARALGPELGGPAAAHTPQLPEGAAVHLALDANSALVAFAAHDGNNRGLGWFGPMGTLPAHRGHGLGEALLIACLADVAAVVDVRDRPDAGVIAWVGPAAFYARASGAAPDRRFVVYQEP